MKKEKKELSFRIDRLDVINESSRLESETLRKEVSELILERNQLKLELSAARIELNYEKEVGNTKKDVVDSVVVPEPRDDKFADELIEKIETLTREKTELAEALEQAVKRKETQDRGQQTDTERDDDKLSQQAGQISTLEAQVEKLRASELQSDQRLAEVREEARARHEADLNALRSETAQLQARLERETKQSRDELEQLEQQLQVRQDDLEATQKRLQEATDGVKAVQAEKDSLSQQLSESEQVKLELKVDMGQNAEKLCAVEERCKGIEKERDDLKQGCL